MSWLSEHYIEVIGAIAGIVFVFLEIRQSILLWPVGILTSLLYVWVFFDSRFYADMALQFYYLAVSFYGWYWWVKGGSKEKRGLPVSTIGRRQIALLSIVTIGLFILIWYILSNFTDSPVPVGDAFTTALSVTATWMLARKILEHWLLWMVINAVSTGLYIWKGLYPTSLLFTVYLVMSVVGWIEWRKDYLLSYNITNDD